MGQRYDARFRGGIGKLAASRATGTHGGIVHDRAAAAFEHERDRASHRVKGATQIYSENVVPLFVGVLVQGLKHPHAGVVDEDGQSLESFVCDLDRLFDRGGIAHVDFDRDAAKRRGRFVEITFFSIKHRDLGSGAMEALCDREANASSRSSDNCTSSVQIFCVHDLLRLFARVRAHATWKSELRRTHRWATPRAPGFGARRNISSRTRSFHLLARELDARDTCARARRLAVKEVRRESH